MRALNILKIPKPNFDFEGFRRWRNDKKSFAIEIGCGVGYHPITWAKTNKNCQLLAIERTAEKYEKFLGRYQQHVKTDLEMALRLWPAHDDANVLLPHLLKPESVDQIFILYPNPEPKAANRRWGRSPSLNFVLSLLKAGSQATFATNIESYATELMSNAAQLGQYSFSMAAIDSHSKPRSHFEKKYFNRGETCFDITILRRP